MGKLKYLFVFTLPALAFMSFHSTGWKAYLPVLEAFAFIPVLELFFTPNENNLSENKKESRISDGFYKFVLRYVFPFSWPWAICCWYKHKVNWTPRPWWAESCPTECCVA